MSRYLCILSLLVMFAKASQASQVIPIAPIEKCFLCSSEPSLTMHWEGKKSKALLLFIPGGGGQIGLKPHTSDHGFHFHQTLKRLTNPDLTSGSFDVVLMDSPSSLAVTNADQAARGSSEHMIRIESVLRFYKEKTRLPVWLMGHSNGALSLSNFLSHARRHGKVDLIDGMIISAARNQSYFSGAIGFPMLFLHHKDDGCENTSWQSSFRNFERVRQANTTQIEFVGIAGGDTESGNPCTSGTHMYKGAGEEVAKQIDRFMQNVYR